MANSTRRKFIVGSLSALGVLGLSGWLAKSKILNWMLRQENENIIELGFAPDLNEDICILTSKAQEGPFYFSSPFRADVREDREGLRLDLELQVLSYPDCTPVQDVIVEIWHSDAHGTYSGYPAVGHDIWEFMKLVEFGKKQHIDRRSESQFLRGAQVTNPEGKVKFTTIVPGWYDPRMPHIHFKVIKNEQEVFVGEFLFEENFFNRVFTTKEPYTQYGSSKYGHTNDKVIAEMTDGQGVVLHATWEQDKLATASAKIGIKLS